jgi:hypothetical protein
MTVTARGERSWGELQRRKLGLAKEAASRA